MFYYERVQTQLQRRKERKEYQGETFANFAPLRLISTFRNKK